MNYLFVFILSLFLALGCTDSAPALTVIPRDFDQLVAKADSVFKGTVSGKTSRWTGEGISRHIVTFVTFQVEETYKGPPTNEQTLRFLGGTVGDDTMEVPDMPQFTVGQRAVLFVVGNGKQFCPLVGVAQGRFHVVKDDVTGRERILTNGGSSVRDTAQLGKNGGDATNEPRLQSKAPDFTEAMTTDEFRAAILRRVAATLVLSP